MVSNNDNSLIRLGANPVQKTTTTGQIMVPGAAVVTTMPPAAFVSMARCSFVSMTRFPPTRTASTVAGDGVGISAAINSGPSTRK